MLLAFLICYLLKTADQRSAVRLTEILDVYNTGSGQSANKEKSSVYDARVIAIRWEPQEEGMMSTAASFPSVRNQGLIDQ